MRPTHLDPPYNAETSNSYRNPGLATRVAHRFGIKLNAGLLVTLIAIAIVAAVLYFGLSQAHASSPKPVGKYYPENQGGFRPSKNRCGLGQEAGKCCS
jgi:hypothetical protein